MKILTTILLSVGNIAQANDFEFIKYIAKQGKSYSTLTEYNERKAHYEELDKFITEFN